MIPLCVDLDGSLIHTDLLYESCVGLVRSQPWRLALLPEWLCRGKAYMKSRIAATVDIAVENLPYNHDLLAWLKHERAEGRHLILCTAADSKYAHAVAKHLGIFDEVMASDGSTNLSSTRKAQALVERFGQGGFVYVGNSSADIPVWTAARHAVVVGSDRFSDRVARSSSVERRIEAPVMTLGTWLHALRLHQWLKNVLLFLPLLGAHRWYDETAMADLLLAFLSYGLCASAVYVVNDLLDLENDRLHPRKRLRPFAAGRISIPAGVTAAVLLFSSALLLALVINFHFLYWLLLYVLLTATYSFFLKAIPLVDSLVLAALYTLRIVAGGAAIAQALSFWLLSFSLFLFLSLAFVKRYSELVDIMQRGQDTAHGRGYRTEDRFLVQSFGVASGFCAALLMALYLHSETVATLYTHPMRLWFTMPTLLLWISWVWFKAARGEMHDDPLVFAMRDFVSIASASLFVFALWFAT